MLLSNQIIFTKSDVNKGQKWEVWNEWSENGIARSASIEETDNENDKETDTYASEKTIIIFKTAMFTKKLSAHCEYARPSDLHVKPPIQYCWKQKQITVSSERERENWYLTLQTIPLLDNDNNQMIQNGEMLLTNKRWRMMSKRSYARHRHSSNCYPLSECCLQKRNVRLRFIHHFKKSYINWIMATIKSYKLGSCCCLHILVHHYKQHRWNQSTALFNLSTRIVCLSHFMCSMW